MIKNIISSPLAIQLFLLIFSIWQFWVSYFPFFFAAVVVSSRECHVFPSFSLLCSLDCQNKPMKNYQPNTDTDLRRRREQENRAPNGKHHKSVCERPHKFSPRQRKLWNVVFPLFRFVRVPNRLFCVVVFFFFVLKWCFFSSQMKFVRWWKFTLLRSDAFVVYFR